MDELLKELNELKEGLSNGSLEESEAFERYHALQMKILDRQKLVEIKMQNLEEINEKLNRDLDELIVMDISFRAAHNFIQDKNYTEEFRQYFTETLNQIQVDAPKLQ